MKYALLVFVGTWLSVFTLGLQSLNVNQGHYLAAAVTSLGIGAGHVLLYRYMPSANLGELAGYFIGGVTGITASMWFHRRAKAWIALHFARLRFAPPSTQPPGRDEHADVQHCGGYQPRGARLTTPPPRSGSGVKRRPIHPDDIH